MKTNFAIAGLLAAVSVPVLAQTAPAPPATPHAMRATMMADKVVTRAEVQAMVQAHFAQKDVNRDGMIAGDEMKMNRRAKGEMHAKHHAGGAMRDPTAMFDRMDANRDGMISRDEFAKAHDNRMEKRSERGAHRMARRHMGGAMMKGQMMKMADSNKDGRITLQEAQSAALQHFDRLDTNRDGRVTPEERRAAHGKLGLHTAG